MSKLNDLISQYCPRGVEYRPLGEVCDILDGQREPITKGARQAGSIPYYGANGIQDYVAEYIFDGTYVLIGEDGSVITSNGTPVVNWAEGKIWVNNHAHIIAEKEGLLLRFFYHYAQTIDIHNLVHGNIPKLTQGDLKALEIPLPPLSVQEEIVRILDNFSLLSAELEAELEGRRKQYDFYRTLLLDFSEGKKQAYEGQSDPRNLLLSFDANADSGSVQWKRLGEVCEFRNGFAFKSDLFRSEGLPIVRITNINGSSISMDDVKYFHLEDYTSANLSPYEIVKGDILVAMSGATTGKVGMYNQDNTAYLNQRTGKFVPKEMLNNRFLYHILTTKVDFMYRMAGGGAQPNLSSNELKEKLIIPIPPLAEQQRIVDILDRFDTLTNDLSQGLPAEIEARKKQYEHYRDKLLTFKRKGE